MAGDLEAKLIFIGAILCCYALAFLYVWCLQMHKKRERYHGSISESDYLKTTWKPALDELNDLGGKAIPHINMVKTGLSVFFSLLGLVLSGAVLLVMGWGSPEKIASFAVGFLIAMFLACIYLLYDNGRILAEYLRQRRRENT